jgi:hypothetical protein
MEKRTATLKVTETIKNNLKRNVVGTGLTLEELTEQMLSKPDKHIEKEIKQAIKNKKS